MATNKPRFSVTFSDESFEKIKRFQNENNISTQSKAVASLVEIAVNELESKGKNAPTPSPDPLRTMLLHNFDELNDEGRERLVETSDDMVASGKYIKSGALPMGKAQGA